MIVPSVIYLLESVHVKGNINCAVRNSIVLEFCDLEFIGASVFEFSHGIRQSHAFNFLCMMVFFSDVIKYVKCSDFFIPSYKIRNPWFVDFFRTSYDIIFQNFFFDRLKNLPVFYSHGNEGTGQNQNGADISVPAFCLNFLMNYDSKDGNHVCNQQSRVSLCRHLNKISDIVDQGCKTVEKKV